MKRTARRQSDGGKQQEGQQTSKCWFRNKTESGFSSFQLHLGNNQAEQSIACKANQRPQQCLYFLPLPHGQGSLRPTFGPERTGLAFSIAAAASLTTSLALPPPCWLASAPVCVCPPKA